VLESQRVTPLGEARDREVTVRIVAATNRDLDISRYDVSDISRYDVSNNGGSVRPGWVRAGTTLAVTPG
jgi:hypothetical protein